MLLSELARSDLNHPAQAESHIRQISGTARELTRAMDEIVWAVNPRNDTIASLASYFGSYAQRLLDLASVACGLDVAEDLPDYPLDPKFRQELFLAFKEGLTNVVRHAAATQVWVRIRVKDGQILVVLADNGRGFDSGARQAGADGLANMYDRLKSLGGVCDISSAPNGTAVHFRAPLPKRLV